MMSLGTELAEIKALKSLYSETKFKPKGNRGERLGSSEEEGKQ